MHHKFCWSSPYRARHFFIFAAATSLTKLEQIQIFLKIRTNTNISTSAKFDKICTISNLSLFVFFSAYIYTESSNFDLFKWKSNNLHDNCGNDSDRADTRDERPLGKISVTACMSLVRILLKRADTGRGGDAHATDNHKSLKKQIEQIFLVRKFNFKLMESLRPGFFSQPKVSIYVNTGARGRTLEMTMADGWWVGLLKGSPNYPG